MNRIGSVPRELVRPLHAGLVPEPLDGPAADDVRLEDLLQVGLLDAGVPDVVRVRHDHRPVPALREAPRLVDPDAVLHPSFDRLGAEGFHHALDIAADGEGATRVGRVEVREARDASEAEKVARAIGNSPLVKTALFGRDPNWGRIAQAAGHALAGEQLPELGPDRIDATELGEETAEPELSVSLGRGEASTHLYFSDLTYDYVRINAEYTT